MKEIMEMKEVRYGILALIASFLLYEIINSIFNSEVLSLVVVLSSVICVCTAKIVNTIENVSGETKNNSEE